ncbi:MAG: SMP-30/gluconolactonase/LRE family protein [Chloroflexi bacterium]|nr:SMP-30/gluconolactonase/LRE family protein [Chloroflexota bacterium]
MANNQIFHSGLGEPEGPVLLADGSWGVVEMSSDTGHVSVISPDGTTKKVVTRTGRPNGMVVDSAGSLLVAESMNPPSLLRVELDGSVDVLMTEGDGVEFLFPNDLAFGPDGALYLTDSGVRRDTFQNVPEADRADYPFDGKIFRIDLSSRSAVVLDDGLAFANGIAFGKDHALYVTTTADGLIVRYAWNDDGSPGPRECFADLVDHTKPAGNGGFRGGDGFAFGENGFLYSSVVGQGDVTVVDEGGTVVERIPVGGDQPTNVAFGPTASGDIYVTVKDAGTLERHHVGVDGLPLLPSS